MFNGGQRQSKIVKRRLKVLVSAYACDPRRGSESAVGWGWCRAISDRHDLWIIAGEASREGIETELQRQPELHRHMHFHYIRQRQLHWLERIWPPLEMITYQHQWQRAAYRMGKELHARSGFDLVHQLTYVGFRTPGYLWKLDVPFVWGPIGGLENTPWRFLPVLGAHGCAYYGVRNLVNAVQKRFSPGPKRAFHKARGGIIAATEGMRREILRWYGHQSEVVCEIGLPPAARAEASTRRADEPLRLAWSGQHQPGKALPLLLRAAMALPRSFKWTLDILGHGRCTPRWQRLARRLGVDDRCRWHGWVARDQALAVVRGAHVFVITSLKDLTSTVLLEALAQGVPVICPDHCGFANVVTGDCGVKLSIDSLGRFQAELTRAIARLADDEPERRRLAAGAIRRAADFSWEKKAEAVDRVYRRVLAKAVGETNQEPVAMAVER